MGEAGKADAQASATTMAEIATSNRVIRNKCTLGSNTGRPHGSSTSHGDIRSTTGGAFAAPAVQPLGQLGETTSSTAVPERSASPAETTTSGRRSVALAPAAHMCGAARRSISSQSAGQLETCPHQRRNIVRIRHHLQELMSHRTAPPLLPRGHRANTAMYIRPRQATGPPPPSDSYAPVPLMPPPPNPQGPLQAHYVLPGEFPSSVSSNWSTNGDSVGGSYLPSAFVGQPVGIDQVGNMWIGDSGANSHMTRSADLMYDTRPPSPHRSRINLGD